MNLKLTATLQRCGHRPGGDHRAGIGPMATTHLAWLGVRPSPRLFRDRVAGLLCLIATDHRGRRSHCFVGGAGATAELYTGIARPISWLVRSDRGVGRGSARGAIHPESACLIRGNTLVLGIELLVWRDRNTESM